MGQEGPNNTVLMNSPFGGLPTEQAGLTNGNKKMTEKENIKDSFSFPDEKGRVVYFIGIGGIGMSAVARYFQSRGAEVSGYDKTETALTRNLQENGIAVHFEENTTLIPKNADLVVYTPAIPK